MLRAGALALAAALLGVASASLAQEPAPNGVLLVARPGMPDPRFREAVVLATQTPDGETVGVVLSVRRLLRMAAGPACALEMSDLPERSGARGRAILDR